MRYLMIVKGDENFSAAGPPPKELMDDGECELRLMYEDGEHP